MFFHQALSPTLLSSELQLRELYLVFGIMDLQQRRGSTSNLNAAHLKIVVKREMIQPSSAKVTGAFPILASPRRGGS